MNRNPFARGTSARKTCAALMAVAMLSMAPLATAQVVQPPAQQENITRTLGFIGCAVAIVFASSTGAVWAAALTCGKVFASQIDQ